MKRCSVEDWDRHTRTINLDKLRVHDKLVNIILSLLDIGKVLEVGAQSGIDAEFLASKGLNVTALDYSDVAISLLKKREGLTVVQSDALSMPFDDNSFDIAYSQGLLEHYVEPELTQLVQEQKRVVKNRGYILIDVPNAYSLFTVMEKKVRIAFNTWIVPWETEYTIGQLRQLGETHGLEFKKAYSWGYLPYIGRRLNNAMRFLFDGSFDSFEKRFGLYYHTCIGMLFQNRK